MKKTVVLGISGGIAAYKCPDIVRRLKKNGMDVYCVMTQAATKFVTPLTFQSLSGNPVSVAMFDVPPVWDVEHIALAKRADVFVIAPATANTIAKMARGVADNMLTATVLATRAPVLLAPAMNDGMYQNSATQENLRILKARGVHMIGPEEGMLANGDVGCGRMSEPEDIAEAVLDMACDVKDFAGKRVLVTAGPTREPVDPVRYMSNRSSGKMGYALAREALRRGAQVTLVTGPSALKPPAGAEVVRVETTEQMLDAVLAAFDQTDVVIKAAAPADYRAAVPAEHKLKKKETGKILHLDLQSTPDILKALAARKRQQYIVGFAAETDDALTNAREKLDTKDLDCLVLNDVSMPGAGFEVDTNIVTIVHKTGTVELGLMSKNEVSARILDYVAEDMK
jgi:phosphopantothenoylcysteine decarboxylase/phosphopantothenate--cysteine ligase